MNTAMARIAAMAAMAGATLVGTNAREVGAATSGSNVGFDAEPIRSYSHGLKSGNQRKRRKRRRIGLSHRVGHNRQKGRMR